MTSKVLKFVMSNASGGSWLSITRVCTLASVRHCVLTLQLGFSQWFSVTFRFVLTANGSESVDSFRHEINKRISLSLSHDSE